HGAKARAAAAADRLRQAGTRHVAGGGGRGRGRLIPTAVSRTRGRRADVPDASLQRGQAFPEGMMRARAPFRQRNVLVGSLLFGFAAAVCTCCRWPPTARGPDRTGRDRLADRAIITLRRRAL